MRLNKKGFSLIEILAAVTILGILMGVAIVGVTRYQQQAREESYEAMEKSAFSAAQNYIQQRNPIIPSNVTDFDEFSSVSTISSVTSDTTKHYQLNIETLVDEGYLPKLQDPASDGDTCSGIVYITKTKASGTKLETYTYLVEISCLDYQSTHTVMSSGTDGIKNTDDDVETNTTARGVFYRS